LLPHGEHAIADVLTADADDVAAPLCGVEPERERQPCLRADRMTCLKRGDLVLTPSVMTVRLCRPEANSPSRIVADQLALLGLLNEMAKRGQPPARDIRRHAVAERDYEFLGQRGELLVAILRAEGFEAAAPHGQRAAGQTAKGL
jgi:hypothetical protein